MNIQNLYFINVCFWHKHESCKYFVVPKARTDFCMKKINKNMEGEIEVEQLLDGMGWLY